MNINFTNAECVRESADIGGKTIYNICDGAQVHIPWGSQDWLGFCVMSGIGALCVVGFITILALGIYNVFAD